MKKKLLSLLLVLAMVLGMFPMNSMAAQMLPMVPGIPGFPPIIDPDLPGFETDDTVTVWFSAVDGTTGEFIVTRHELEVPAGTGETYGQPNAAPGHTVGGQDHGVEEGEVTPMDALFAAHEEYYGEEFTPETAGTYVEGQPAYMTKIFGKTSRGGISFTVNDRLPVGPASDGFAANEYVLQEGDEVVWYLYGSAMYNDHYSYFVDENGEYVKKLTVGTNEAITLSLEAFNAMEQLFLVPDPDTSTPDLTLINPEGIGIRLATKDGKGATIGSETIATTGANGSFRYTFTEAGTYYLTATGSVSTDYGDAPIIMPWCEVEVIAPLAEGDGVYVWPDGDVIGIIDQVLEHPDNVVFPYTPPEWITESIEEGTGLSLYTSYYDFENDEEVLIEAPIENGKVTLNDAFESAITGSSWNEYFISTSGHESVDDLWSSDVTDYISICVLSTKDLTIKYYDAAQGGHVEIKDGDTIVVSYAENGNLSPSSISFSFHWTTADGVTTQGGDWPNVTTCSTTAESVVKPTDGRAGLTVMGKGEATCTLGLKNNFWSGFEPITFTVEVAKDVDAATAAVIDQIRALPTTANIFDKAAVEAARAAYDALTPEQQEKVANYAKLEGLEAALEELEGSFSGQICSIGYLAPEATATTTIAQMSGRDEWTGANIAKAVQSVTLKVLASEDTVKVTVDGVAMTKGDDGFYTLTLNRPTDHDGLTLYKVEAFKEGSDTADEAVTVMLFWTGDYPVVASNYSTGFQPGNTQINLYRGNLDDGLEVFNSTYTYNNTGVSDKHVSYKVSNSVSERIWIRYNVRGNPYNTSDVEIIDPATGKVVSQRFWSEITTSPSPYEGPEAGEGIELKVGSNLLLAKMWPVNYENVNGEYKYVRKAENPTVMALYLDRLDDTLSTETGITSIEIVGDVGGTYAVEQVEGNSNGSKMEFFETTVAPNETGIKVIYKMPENVNYLSMNRSVTVGSLVPQEREPVSNTVADGVRTVVLHYGTYDERYNDFYTEYGAYLDMVTQAEDGVCMETFRLNFTRPALPADGVTDSDLKTLTISGGTLTPAFDPSVTEYTVELDATVKQFMVTAIAKFGTKGATVTVDGKFVNQTAGNQNQGKSETYAAAYGMNQEIEIVVTPPAGSSLEPKTYTVTVTKPNADNGSPLVKGWVAQSGSAYQLIEPDNSGSTGMLYVANVGLTYTDDATGSSISNGALYMYDNITAVGNVDGVCSQLTLRPDIAMSSSALTFSYTVNGGESVSVPAGSTAFNIPVPNEGLNTIVVTFQNEAGTIIKNHTFKITKAPNATLAGLSSEDAVFVGKFNPTMYRMNMMVEPGTESISVTATAAKEGATVVFNGVTGTGSATAEGLVKDTEYTIDVSYEGQTYRYYLTIKERQAFSANRVWATMPAPGQFVNEHSQTTTGTLGAQGWGDGWDTTLYGATPEQAGKSNYAQPGYSLGWFGGFITYEFDEPIQNSDKNKYGVDFMVYGNAFSSNPEPAGVMVSQDGETWYTLAGSKHYDADTVWNYEVTYLNPNPDFSPYESTNVPYIDNKGGGGTFMGNGYHSQPNYPVADNYLFEGNHAADIYDSAELTLSGTLTNGAGFWGYADVKSNPTSDFDKPNNPYVSTIGDGFDISWAVDENGMPVELDYVKYVKVYNASIGVAVGEVSPEITAIARTTGEAESVGTTEAPVITVNGRELELTDGDYTYDVPMSGTIEVTASLEGGVVWINNDNDGTYNEGNVVSGRIVRVLAQKGEAEPVIYYLTMVSSVAGDEDVAEVEELIAAIGEVTLAKENQIKAARAAFNALPTGLQSRVSNYATLAAAETALQSLKDNASGGPVVDNTITVSMRLIGAELAEDDVDLGTVVYRPDYVTWIATTAYEMDKGSTVYDLFVEAMNDAGLTQVGAENNYVATIYSPSGYELSEFTNGNRSGWMYTINGSHPGRGLVYQPLRDGDEVVWHYVNDYAWEVEDWFAIGGGQWPQLSDEENNYWDGWLLAPDYVGGKGGALPTSGSDVPGSPSGKDDGADGEITVPISGDENTIHVGATVEGTKATIDEVDLTDLNKVVGDQVDTGTLTIDFSGLESDKPITTVELPADTVKKIAEAVNDPANDAHSLEIVLPGGASIEFDAAALEEKASQAKGEDITISIVDSGEAKLTGKQTQAVGDRPAYDINVTSGGKHISDMGGNITVHAPYELKPGEKACGIVVYYVDDNGNRERCVTSYDPIKQRVNWKTDHLSLYMIDYDETLANNPFTDVTMDNYYFDAVLWAVDEGITNGTSDTTFSPDASCTRAQMVTFLWRAAGSPKAAATTCVFTDVDAGSYYYEALLWAVENGITNGTSDTTFSPEEDCNRGQMATFLYRNAKTPSVSGNHDFADVKADAYYNDAVIWAAEQKITNGTSDTTFSPDEDCTRGQMVTFLYRYLAE